MKKCGMFLLGVLALLLAFEPMTARAGTGATTRVSVSSAGVQGSGGSYYPSISADGRYVAFESSASNLVAGDTNGRDDIFVHDRTTGATTRVSIGSAGGQGNNSSYAPSISADGRYVAFESSASNLVAGDTNGDGDIFVHDRTLGTTTRVSVDSAGTQGNDRSNAPSISADGRYVAFNSRASNLVAGDTNGDGDIFVHDRTLGTTTRVSVDSAGAQGSYTGIHIIARPSISADGRYVAFSSPTPNLVTGDTNGHDDVFVHDRTTGITTRVSIDAAGTQGNGHSVSPSISADGRYVAFASFSNLAPGDNNRGYDVFVHDRTTGTTTGLSFDSEVTRGQCDIFHPSISADGRYVAFGTFNTYFDYEWEFYVSVPLDVLVHDRDTGETISVGGFGRDGDRASYASLSANGRNVAFDSTASNLVAGDTNGTTDVFVHDRFGGGTIGGDPVPHPDSNSTAKQPILLLVAGINSNTGGVNMHRPGYSEPWGYLRDDTPDLKKVLGVGRIIHVPTGEGVVRSRVIDSTGGIDYNVGKLNEWLQFNRTNGERFGDSPLILVGHSYGGVIARSWATDPAYASSPLRAQVAGIVQFGSPNDGSQLAEAANGYANNNVALAISGLMKGECDATHSLERPSMIRHNSKLVNSSGIPVFRIGGEYLPGALSRYPRFKMMLGVPRPSLLWTALDSLNIQMGGLTSDGAVTERSLNGRTSNLNFGSGAYWPILNAPHSKAVPGAKGSNLPGLGGIDEEIVPQSSGSYGLRVLGYAIARCNKSYSARTGTVAKRSMAVSAASVGDEPGSRTLPVREVSVAAGTAKAVTIALDAPVTLFAASSEAVPTLSAGAGVMIESDTVSESGSHLTFATLAPSAPGLHTISVGLAGGVSGTVTLEGHSSGAAELDVRASEAPVFSGVASAVTARLSRDGEPLAGAAVTGRATKGEDSVALTFADDGVAPDVTASDGIYTASFVPPSAGSWVVRADAHHTSCERTDSAVVTVGDAGWASLTGSGHETLGPGSPASWWGATFPVSVSQEGTYTVRCVLEDANGSEIAKPAATKYLAVGAGSVETTVAADVMAQIADGPLIIKDVLLYRETSDGELPVDIGEGFVTGTRAPQDFRAFYVSLAPLQTDPTNSSKVSFSGEAVYTPGAITGVEYTLDAGANWSDAAATDGAFDEAIEPFEIDLDLTDGVYGVHVRAKASDGSEQPSADWAGDRFIIDTTAPAKVAVPTVTVADSVATFEWDAVEEPSESASAVFYRVTLDGTPVGETFDTSHSIELPDAKRHSLGVVATDQAGNAAAATIVEVGDGQAPVTISNVVGSYVGSALITLTATDAGSGVAKTEWRLGMSGDWTAGTKVMVTTPGTYTLQFRSVDKAGNIENAKTVKFTVVAPAPPPAAAKATSLALTSKSASALGYGKAFKITGTLKSGSTLVAGRQVILLSAAPGKEFKDTSLKATTNSKGVFTFSVKPSAKTSYKVRFAGVVGSYKACGPTAAVTATPKVSLGTPVAPKTMKKGKAYTVYGSLKPKHAKNTKPVRIYKYKKVGKKWVSKGYVTAKAYNYKTYTRYKAKVKLTSKGTWRLRAQAPKDSLHAKTWSAKHKTVKVK